MDRLREAQEAYRRAFNLFAKQVQHVQALTAQPNINPQALELALVDLERAHVHYDVCRDRWAQYLLPTGPKPARDPERSHSHCVRTIAEILWESAGRPEGTADEDWRKAEEIVKAAAAVAA
ncbi:MAG TPA: DUF2934 domain-containing protein [Bryobacteraceae bacterium]|nr:DUF2934 domain-containing protein [Bryobacteraceae bacterium]